MDKLFLIFFLFYYLKQYLFIININIKFNKLIKKNYIY